MSSSSTDIGSVDPVIDILFVDVETVATNHANTLGNVAIVCGRRQVYPRQNHHHPIGESTMLFQQFGLGHLLTIVASSTNDSTVGKNIL